MSAPSDASRRTVRIAISIWFVVLLGCLFATDAIAQLDPAVISLIVVTAAAVLFTSMQVIAREMSRSVPGADVPYRRPVPEMAARNLAVVAAIYAVLWLLGALPF